MSVKFGVLAYSRPTAYAYMPNFVSTGLFCRPISGGENPNFAVFWFRHLSDVAIWQQSEKAEHECTTTNLPLSYLYSNDFMAKSGAQIGHVLAPLNLLGVWRMVSPLGGAENLGGG